MYSFTIILQVCDKLYVYVKILYKDTKVKQCVMLNFTYGEMLIQI